MQVTVLVASSYPLIVEGITGVLKSHKDEVTVIAAGSCREAMEEIQRVLPDIAIFNQHFNDGYGLDMIKTCKDKYPSTKFVFMSYMARIKIFEQAMQEGASSILAINATKDELLSAVNTALTNEIYVQPKLAALLFGNKKASPDGEILLTPRQQQTIELMASGCTNKEIASSLGLSIETVNTHVKQILKKLNAKDRAQAVAIAFRRSLIF